MPSSTLPQPETIEISAGARQVVEQFDEIVKPEGGSVALLSASAGVLKVSYRAGVNEECADCVMEPDALAAMMRDMVVAIDDSIESVEVVAEEHTG